VQQEAQQADPAIECPQEEGNNGKEGEE